jgi:hypothetical protein
MFRCSFDFGARHPQNSYVILTAAAMTPFLNMDNEVAAPTINNKTIMLDWRRKLGEMANLDPHCWLNIVQPQTFITGVTMIALQTNFLDALQPPWLRNFNSIAS